MNNLVITNKGQELMTALIAGTNHATFTEIVTSNYDYGDADLTALETLEGVRQTSPISSVEKTDNNIVQIVSAINNTAVTSGYYIKIVGIYAVDDTGNKILYGVTTETENPIYIPAFGGKTETSVDFIFNVRVDNSENVNLIVDSSATPSRAEFNNLKIEVQTALETVENAVDTVENIATIAETAQSTATAAQTAVTEIQTKIESGEGVPASTLGGKTADEFADAEHTHTTADITDMPTSLPANGGNADTVDNAHVVTTAALGLHRMASGTSAATSASCPPGCWYGQYE